MFREMQIASTRARRVLLNSKTVMHYRVHFLASKLFLIKVGTGLLLKMAFLALLLSGYTCAAIIGSPQPEQWKQLKLPGNRD